MKEFFQSLNRLRRVHQDAFNQETTNHENPSISADSNVDDVEKENRLIIEDFIFSKLSEYSRKSQLWKIKNVNQLKKRLIKKSSDICKQHGFTREFVIDSIEEIVNRIEKQIRNFSPEFNPSMNFLQEMKNPDNDWRKFQLKRAKRILPSWDNDNELLEKYFDHVVDSLTPKMETNDAVESNRIREQPFNLNVAYDEAKSKALYYLKGFLTKFRSYGAPDLRLIEEMVQHGLHQMKVPSTSFKSENDQRFSSKLFQFIKMKDGYSSGLKNMADDFMLLRFGKVFGVNAMANTPIIKRQFIYLVHLFIQSFGRLIFLMKTHRNERRHLSMINTLNLANLSHSIVKVKRNSIFSPKFNVDRWTWLLRKWRDALRTFPIFLTKAGAFTRLLRTTIGIGIARLYHIAEKLVEGNRMFDDSSTIDDELFHALQLGFYFGVAYAVVDCSQDEVRNLDPHSFEFVTSICGDDTDSSNIAERIDQWLLVMEKALIGEHFDRGKLPKTPMTPILIETFDNIVLLTQKTNSSAAVLNELALLLRSQRMDKTSFDQCLNDEQLYLGAMLKSHFTYTCTTFLGHVESAREESERLWFMPFLGQITDDCRDFYDDFIAKSVTSFTHYATFIGRYQTTDERLINPFYVFLHLCSDIYRTSQFDPDTGAFLGRRILRTLKSIEISAELSGLRQFLHIFSSDNIELHDYCLNKLRNRFDRVNDPEKTFFRSIQKYSVDFSRTNRKLETYIADHLHEIEKSLSIDSINEKKKIIQEKNYDEQLLLSAMNYSVKAGGKRLRPLLLFMASDLYGLDVKRMMPLARAIEYLHTSSLILDDLPAQDNSDLRRGRPTLHKATIDHEIPENLCEGRAQLAAVDLIAISLNVINKNLIEEGFSSDSIIDLIYEISGSMHDLCVGQMQDLRAARIGLESNEDLIEQLDHIGWYKTGKAIEMGLIAPAILTLHRLKNRNEEIDRIRELSRLMGILFQMRDDLLDIDGENIGKPIELDVKNKTVTYVSILGVEGTRQRLNQFRQATLQLVDQCWPKGAGTLKDVINYIVDRKN